MSDAIESGTIDNVTWRVVYDDSPENPRFWGRPGHMLFAHGQYDLGDDDAKDFLSMSMDDLGSWSEMANDLRDHHGAEVMNVFMFDHSGLAFSTSSSMFEMADSAGWDWGQIGLIFMTEEEIRREFGSDELDMDAAREKARALMDAEVDLYEDYVEGRCYGYIVTRTRPLYDKDGNHVTDDEEELDDLWGIYGLDHAVAMAKDAARIFAELMTPTEV